MATQGTDYFALFMMNNQDRITRSLTQARSELDFVQAEQAYQRQYLMDQLAKERASLAKIRSTRVTFSSGGKRNRRKLDEIQEMRASGSAQSRVRGMQEQAGRGAVDAFNPPPAFTQAYVKSKDKRLLGQGSPAQYASDYEKHVIKDMRPQLHALPREQQNQAMVEMAADLSANSALEPANAFAFIASRAQINATGMAPTTNTLAVKKQEARDLARADIEGEEAILEARSQLVAMQEGRAGTTGASRGRSTEPYLTKQAEAAEVRIQALEDQLEEIAMEPVRMEDIRTRAGEIHAPYTRKKKQKEIERARTLRAMSLTGWQKSFAAAGNLGHEYSWKIADGKDFGREGSTGEQFASGLFTQIQSKDITLPQAMARIAEEVEGEEEQRKAVAVLVAQGLLGYKRESGPPVPGQENLEEEIRKAKEGGPIGAAGQGALLGIESVLGTPPVDPDIKKTRKKKGRKSKAPAEQELEDIAIDRGILGKEGVIATTPYRETTGIRPDVSMEDISVGPGTSGRPDLGFEPTSEGLTTPREDFLILYQEQRDLAEKERLRRLQAKRLLETPRSQVMDVPAYEPGFQGPTLEPFVGPSIPVELQESPVYAPEPLSSNEQEIRDNQIINNYITRGYPGLLDSLLQDDLNSLERNAIQHMPDNHWLAFARKLYPEMNDDIVLLRLQSEYGAP